MNINMPPIKPCCSHEGKLQQYFSYGETDFAHCPQCGIVFRHPMPTSKELDAIYADLYRSDNIVHSTTNQESGSFAIKKYVEFLKSKIIVPNGKVLDYGCGSGELVELLCTSGVNAAGLERSEAARQYALSHRGLKILPDINAIPRHSLDLVTMIEVIEHLPDPCPALSEIRDRLRPGGMIFITTPNRGGFRALLERGQWREAKKKFHVVLFDKDSLVNILRMAGYAEIRQIRYSPVQRTGLKGWAMARLLQVTGIPGSLCMTARVPR